MDNERNDGILDSLVLRFDGRNEDGTDVHELRASHVSEVLEGLVGLSEDFEKAGVFHSEGPEESEVLVRPAKEGSFLIEVVRTVTENWETVATYATAGGIPTLGQIVWWATKSARAEVKDFSHLDNGNVKITWQDDTAEEIPTAAWDELNKRKRRRKKQLRQIMAPLEDPRVTELDLTSPLEADREDNGSDEYTLTKADYVSVKPSDEVDETFEVFEAEAQMSAIDFDDPTKWKVRAGGKTRTATVEDEAFLSEVAQGLPISKDDIFQLRVREDRITKNERTRTSWTILSVERQRRATDDNET